VSLAVTPVLSWLAAVWPFVRAQLPSRLAPAAVAKSGAGRSAAFVPVRVRAGYDAVASSGSARGRLYRKGVVEGIITAPVAASSPVLPPLHHVPGPLRCAGARRAALPPGGGGGRGGVGRENGFDEATTARCAITGCLRPGQNPDAQQAVARSGASQACPWQEYIRVWARRRSS